MAEFWRKRWWVENSELISLIMDFENLAITTSDKG